MSSSSSPTQSGPSTNIDRGSRSFEDHTLFSMMEEGISPRVLLNHLAPSFQVPSEADDMMLWRLLVSMIEPPRRKKLTQYNTIEDAIKLINKSKKIMVLSGAGISTSAGLPDFRSRDGIYVQIHAEHPDLHDPKYMFDIEYFRKNPLPFYQFARALYPGQYKPTIGHKFIRCIGDHNKLLRNYSQNIDTLEKQAGIQRVVECHGSFARATCTRCKYSVDCDTIRDDIMNQKVPLCPKCNSDASPDKDNLQLSLAVMKPNIVFFGEQLGEEFHHSLEADKEQVDLLIVIGSSLKVRPVALIPKSVPASVPQILINKEPLDHMTFDIELLGNCDDIIQEICLRLGGKWMQICNENTTQLKEISGLANLNMVRAAVSTLSTRNTELDPECQLTADAEEKQSAKTEDSQNEVGDDVSSFKSNQAIVASESLNQDMIEDLDENIEFNVGSANQSDKKNKSGSAILTNCDQNSDDDWEDIEILQTSTSSSSSNSREIASLNIPEATYLFLKPNKYIFRGAELSNAQLETYTKDLQVLEREHKTTANI